MFPLFPPIPHIRSPHRSERRKKRFAALFLFFLLHWGGAVGRVEKGLPLLLLFPHFFKVYGAVILPVSGTARRGKGGNLPNCASLK